MIRYFLSGYACVPEMILPLPCIIPQLLSLWYETICSISKTCTEFVKQFEYRVDRAILFLEPYPHYFRKRIYICNEPDLVCALIQILLIDTSGVDLRIVVTEFLIWLVGLEEWLMRFRVTIVTWLL
jgi:hypothetical protein